MVSKHKKMYLTSLVTRKDKFKPQRELRLCYHGGQAERPSGVLAGGQQGGTAGESADGPATPESRLAVFMKLKICCPMPQQPPSSVFTQEKGKHSCFHANRHRDSHRFSCDLHRLGASTQTSSRTLTASAVISTDWENTNGHPPGGGRAALCP
uniref:cDNA FLJ27329 fis, clone TMS08376 n=1 Tax=Homo sapiens TaxID=9606 RepID=Q6ZNQ7_HUMAN|nr:unnamed protein product [Homo sapiens]